MNYELTCGTCDVYARRAKGIIFCKLLQKRVDSDRDMECPVVLPCEFDGYNNNKKEEVSND